MESESARRERRMETAWGRVHLTSSRARVQKQQFPFLFFLCIPNLCGVKKMAFLSGFAEQFQLSSNIAELLKEEAFDSETALLGLLEQNKRNGGPPVGRESCWWGILSGSMILTSISF